MAALLSNFLLMSPKSLSRQIAHGLGQCRTPDEIFSLLDSCLEFPRQSLILFHHCEHLHPLLLKSPYEGQMAILGFIQMHDPMLKKVATTGQPDLRVDRRKAPSPLCPDELCGLAVPLFAGQRVIGVLYLGSRQTGSYDQSTLDSVSEMAALVGPALGLAWRESELACETPIFGNDTASKLLKAGQTLRCDPKTVAKSLVDLLPKTRTALVLRLDPERPVLTVSEVQSRPHKPWIDLELSAQTEAWFRIFEKERTQMLDDPAEVDPVFRDELAMLAPLLGRDNKILGCLYLGSDQTYDEQERLLLDNFAVMVSLSLELERVQRESRDADQPILRDSLTGLLNEVACQTVLTEELSWSHQGVLFHVDIDRLKLAVSHFGRNGAEAALKAAADCLSQEVGPGRTLFRYSDDEFLVLVRDLNASQARREAERYRLALWQTLEPWALTVSIGMAYFSGGDTTFEALLSASRTALVTAKEDGGNRVSD